MNKKIENATLLWAMVDRLYEIYCKSQSAYKIIEICGETVSQLNDKVNDFLRFKKTTIRAGKNYKAFETSVCSLIPITSVLSAKANEAQKTLEECEVEYKVWERESVNYAVFSESNSTIYPDCANSFEYFDRKIANSEYLNHSIHVPSLALVVKNNELLRKAVSKDIDMQRVGLA